MLKLNHGIPTSPFFLIALPCKGEPMGEKVRMGTTADPLKTAELTDPNTKEVATVEIHDAWRFKVTDAPLINAFSKLAYGITGPQLIAVMRKRYAPLTEVIEFLLVKKN